VLQGAKSAEYRLDYVTFPENLPVETFRRPDSGIPRAWLSAVAYRHGQCWWGVHRENDPLPRLVSPQKSIKPGKTEPLVHVDGAGVVLWTKLRANKNVLDKDDLWLEVTVDGEREPAVSAPARYWFPGLAGQDNYPNFIMTDRGGVTNLLAMPYGDGITISATNRGKKAIGGVGVTVSVEPAAEQNRSEIAQRMRLRGVFQPEGGKQLIHQSGTGRWVGLVYRQPVGEAMGVESLLIDGQPAAGWTGPMDGFLGQGGDFRRCLSGRHSDLCWRYLIMEAVDFQKSLVLKGTGDNAGARLALFYMAK